jgi:dTDP-4-amino-4,6-dideoxygalactose transaminase
MEVTIFNLDRDHHDIRNRLREAFDRVLASGEYVLGKEVRAFEEAFAAYIGVKYAIGVNSGTDALKIGGLALGLKPGDKMVTTPNTYMSTAMSLSMHGIIPLFCDIEPDTCNMDPKKLEELFKKERGIKLCVPVHLYGHPAAMGDITSICREYGVAVLEDACQAHGALYDGKKVGGIGDAGAFSFYPTKNLGCYGDGGIIVTDSPEVYERATMLRAYGQSAKHVHTIEGFNSRLDEVQAALLSVKLESLDYWNTRRRHAAWLYLRELSDVPIVLPREVPGNHHVYHLYAVRSSKRDELMKFLSERGITTLVHYPTPIHLQKVYEHFGYGPGSFPVAEEVQQQVLSLPLYPTIRETEVVYVATQIREFYGLTP